jgi:hypothetical protein
MVKALHGDGTGRYKVAQQHCQLCAVIFLARLGIKLENRNANRLHGTLQLYVRLFWHKLSTTGKLRLIGHRLSGIRIADFTSKMRICDRAFTPREGTMRRVNADYRAEIYKASSSSLSWRLST